MKFNKNSLKVKIWSYLIVFSIAILAFLWFFQVVFLDTYYKWYKSKDIVKIGSEVASIYFKNGSSDTLDQLSFQKNICIEITDSDGNTLYTSGIFNRGCIAQVSNSQKDYKKMFILSDNTTKLYESVQNRFNNQFLIYALRLDEDVYAFLSTSVEPMDRTATILTSQLGYVTIVVLLLSFVIAYFISKKISGPITKISKSALKMSKGEYDVVFTTDADIDEINELTDTLNHTRDELSKTESLRRELMANVSHDLRTPLTMIKAYAEMVRDLTYSDKEKRDKNLNIIIDETDRLNLLVNDILDLSSIQSETSMLHYEEFDLDLLIQEIIKRYDIYVTRDGYVIEYTGCSCMIRADKKRMEQVIYNLMNNALNYTGEDKKIIVKLTKKDKSCLVEIADTGKGINKEDLPFIWDKYYKADKTHSRLYLGTGIGLSIVKSILERHKFEYGVQSKKNKGTTFYFEIKI